MKLKPFLSIENMPNYLLQILCYRFEFRERENETYRVSNGEELSFYSFSIAMENIYLSQTAQCKAMKNIGLYFQL